MDGMGKVEISGRSAVNNARRHSSPRETVLHPIADSVFAFVCCFFLRIVFLSIIYTYIYICCFCFYSICFCNLACFVF